MSEKTKSILRNNDGDPTCQYYNESADQFEVQKGANGSSNVAVTSLPPLPSGDNNIGNVDIVTMPNITIGTALPSGNNNIGDVDVASLPSLPIGSNIIGKVGLDSANNTVKIDSANNDVDVLSLPGSAHHSPVSGNPVRIGVRAVTSNYAAIDNGDTADLICSTTGALITKPYSIPDLDWQFNCSAAITNTSDVSVKASAGAGIRNYITSFQYQNTNATATEVVIKDGSTVIWRGYAPANMTALANVQLLTPLKGSVATAVNFACITTGANLYFNAQGYSA